MPSILKKQLDRRQTFDTVAIKAFDAEMAKHLCKLQSAAMESEIAFRDKTAAVRAAEGAIVSAKENRDTISKELAAATTVLAHGVKALGIAKQHLRDFPKDAKQAANALNRAQAQLSAFRAGPLGAVEELQIRVSPPPFDGMFPQAVAREAPIASPATTTLLDAFSLWPNATQAVARESPTVPAVVETLPRASSLCATATSPAASVADAIDVARETANNVTMEKEISDLSSASGGDVASTLINTSLPFGL